MNTWETIEKYPPALVRLLGRERKGGKQIRAISDQEIALKSRLTVGRVRQIYMTKTWDSISVGEMRRFIQGCGFDPHDAVVRNRIRAYRRLKGAKFRYLVKSPWWESTFRPLIKKMQEDGIQLAV